MVGADGSVGVIGCDGVVGSVGVVGCDGVVGSVGGVGCDGVVGSLGSVGVTGVSFATVNAVVFQILSPASYTSVSFARTFSIPAARSTSPTETVPVAPDNFTFFQAVPPSRLYS